MEFELNEEQQQIKQSIREFAEAELRPHVSEWDESQRFPVELRPKFAELGVMGVLFPEEYGGAGMGYVEYATIVEELSRVDPSIALSIAAHNSLGAGHIFIARQRHAEREISRPAGSRRAFCCVGFDRAKLRLGRKLHANRGRATKRRLDHKRLEELHHQRDVCGNDRCARDHRPHGRVARHIRIHNRARRERILSRKEREQARHARERHGHDRF